MRNVPLLPDRRAPRGRSWPLVLLLIGAQRHYLYEQFPAGWQDDVWNICGAVAVLALAWATVAAWPSRWAVLVAIWLSAEEALVAGCSAWWLVDPLIVAPGDEQCTARVGFKFGAVGIAAVAYLMLRINAENSSKRG